MSLAVIVPTAVALAAVAGLNMRSKEYFTSAEVSGVPSWNLTPSLISHGRVTPSSSKEGISVRNVVTSTLSSVQRSGDSTMESAMADSPELVDFCMSKPSLGFD